MMSETWVDKKDWRSIARFLPKRYVWEMQEARKDHAKESGMGSMVLKDEKGSDGRTGIRGR